MGNGPVMAAASFTERREDLRGGFMLCFLDDGAGMDPSKWWDCCFVWGVEGWRCNHFYKILIMWTCFSVACNVMSRRSTWGVRSLLQHLRLNSINVFARSCLNMEDRIWKAILSQSDYLSLGVVFISLHNILELELRRPPLAVLPHSGNRT